MEIKIKNTFAGYPRKRGPAGIRNVVLVIAGDLCCNPYALEIAAPFDNCHALIHKHGVGNYGPDRELFRRLISNITIHPNMAGFVFVSSGNEDHPPEDMVRLAGQFGKSFRVVSIPKEKPGGNVVSRGIEYAQALSDAASRARRVLVDIASLRIGLNCAGTDVASGQTVHRLCGRLADVLVGLDATVLFSETPDLIGVEKELFRRCSRPADRKMLKTGFRSHKQRLAAGGENISDVELGGFNISGGLKTLRQKAHISLMKAGTSPIREAVDYGEIPSKHGLVFADGPAMSDFVITGYMASGVHLIINTCGAGAGNQMPFIVGADVPSPIIPTVKLTASRTHFRQKSCRIDFDASEFGNKRKATVSSLLSLVVAVASGKRSRTETGGDFMLNIPAKFYQA